jgi:hypothetical protein
MSRLRQAGTVAASQHGVGWWAPQEGDIVRLKPGFDRTFEALGVRRAGLPLKEKALYEVLGYEQRELSRVLMLREVHVVHVAGVRHVTKVGSEPFPYALEKFELAGKHRG